MKTIILIFSVALMTISCGSTTYLDQASLSSAIEKREFNYNATKAFPLDNNSVNNILNSFPGGAGAGRLMNLDPGYGFNLKKDLFSVYLPYFGRAFNVSPADVNNGGIRFESKKFAIKQSLTKKGNTLLVITPEDHKVDFVFNLEIFKNGSAFLSVNSNDRQPISYDGSLSVGGN
ncbi:DUF4251 domain-containing protein [Chryseobacterium sp. FH1]|uniref:DUF4251 domain-containing protein n=1 Tax=Chryseobacterium sp. FH1 TaxID=1233951 RepID=UPI0013F45334|nr:DUF4251 domain-containing protein [Chryseobacterium sp. FH1]